MFAYAFLAVLFLQVFNDVQCTDKKGAVFLGEDYVCGDWQALNNMAWWCDYMGNLDLFRSKEVGCSQSIDDLPEKDRFVPMIADGQGIPTIEQNAAYLIGFNEPNHMSQANLTPQQAADLWPAVMAAAAGRILVGPSPAYCAGGDCIGATTAVEWYASFDQLCGNCYYDYPNTHIYLCNVADIMAVVDELAALTGKPVWVTEFACPQITHPYAMLMFLKMIVPVLDASPNVFRYAWYATRFGINTVYVDEAVALLEKDVPVLTECGAFYNAYPGGNVFVEDPSNHDFNEPVTPLKVLSGVFKEEALVTLTRYTEKPCDWTAVLPAMNWNLKSMAGSAQAFYVYNSDDKPAQKTRIRNFFNSIMCATEAQISDAEVWAEVVRISALGETNFRPGGKLKMPTC